MKNIWHAVMEQAHEGKAYREFSGTDALTTAEICTKCGNLAVEGLCDVTVQGDMTQTEYYAPGTEPAEPCGCHVKMNYCRRSGEPAGNYCWLYGVEPRVYLAEGSAETADAVVAAPEDGAACQMHRTFWNPMFQRGDEAPEDSGAEEEELYPDGRRDWFDRWFRH